MAPNILLLLTFVVTSYCALINSPCDLFCLNKFKNENVFFCAKGCVLLGANIQPSKRGQTCEDACVKIGSDDIQRAACYEGCNFIEPQIIFANDISDHLTAQSMFNISKMRELLSHYMQLIDIKPDGVFRRIRFRIYGPYDDKKIIEPYVSSLNINEMDAVSNKPSFWTKLSRGFHYFIYELSRRPLLTAAFILLLVNLIFLVIVFHQRSRRRRMAQIASQQQTKKMSEFFEPTYIKINLTSSQNEKEADELAPKLPLD